MQNSYARKAIQSGKASDKARDLREDLPSGKASDEPWKWRETLRSGKSSDIKRDAPLHYGQASDNPWILRDAQGIDVFDKMKAALSSGREREVEELLERGVDVNARVGRWDNALELASYHGHEGIVKLLLENGADVNARDGIALRTASERGHVEILKLLLEKGADLNARDGVRGDNALEAASDHGHERIVQLLLERGADINAQDETNARSALHKASYRGHEDAVKLLLEKGADINIQGEIHGSALAEASAHGHERIVKLLLEKGADINAQGGMRGSALANAIGHERLVKLLLEKGADTNPQGETYGSALARASARGHERIVKLLLEKGADVNAQGGIYDSALAEASNNGHERIVKLLLEKGADVNAQGGIHGNVLQTAVKIGHDEIIKLLLERGADVNARSENGTAMEMAISCGNKKVIELLLERGVHVNAGREQAQGGAWLQSDKETDVSARIEHHDSVRHVASHRDYGAAQNTPTLDETKHMAIPETTGADSSGSGHKNTRESDDVFGIRDSTATRDDRLESGYKISSDEDEDPAIDDSISPEYQSPLASSETTRDDSLESGYEVTSDEDEDPTVDDSTSPEYDLSLASLRARISDPVEYFSRLQVLAHLTYQHSTLQIYKSHWPRTVAEKEGNFEPYPGYPQSQELTLDDFQPLPDSQVMRTCQDVAVFHNAFANDLLEILECRNVIAQTCMNLKRLQLDGFCGQKFSMLMIDPCRHDVVRLLPLDIQQILQILMETDSVLRKAADSAGYAPPTTSSAQVLLEQALEEPDNLLLSVPRCTAFLTTLGLDLASPADTSVNLSILACMRLVVHTLDLAVASYAGAHLGRFDKEYPGEELDTLDILNPFTSRHISQVPSIKLSRCQLQCLDSFHNSQPLWVFSSSDWKPRDQLFLSTKIEDFADIWGPLWKVVDSEKNGSCTRYAVGNGSIYKYKPGKATPRLFENESLCHWISDTNLGAVLDGSSNTEKPMYPDILDESFNGNEILLIGAVAAGCERLATNTDCNFDLEHSRAMLDHVGRVQMLGTVREHIYKDSETYQLQAGHSGMGVSASKQYKRRGQSLKQAFVEQWTTTPENRDPRWLEHFYGLEISLCTQNAQRVQLLRILGFDSMCRYLRSFRWKTCSAKKAFFDALEGFKDDSDAFQRAWERHNDYQDDFGCAVLVCLKALEKTGVNHKSQLSTFLCSDVTARPELVTMEPKEHSWIGLLKDSEISCCMAAIGDECLEFRHEFGSVCGRSGRSCLRTALIINRLSKPQGICKKRPTNKAVDGWTSRWSVRAMETSSDVWLGRHGTLRLLHHLPDNTLLMDWRASPIITAVKSFIDKEKPHREYSEDIQKEARRTRPVPLFVISNP